MLNDTKSGANSEKGICGPEDVEWALRCISERHIGSSNSTFREAIRAFALREQLAKDGVNKVGLKRAGLKLVQTIYSNGLTLDQQSQLYEVCKRHLLENPSIKKTELIRLLWEVRRDITGGKEGHQAKLDRFESVLRSQGYHLKKEVTPLAGTIDVCVSDHSTIFDIIKDVNSKKEMKEAIGGLTLIKQMYPRAEFAVVTTEPLSDDWMRAIWKLGIKAVFLTGNGEILGMQPQTYKAASKARV